MSEVRVEQADPADEPVRWCLERYAAEIAERFGWDPETSLPLGDDDLRPPRGLMLLATRNDEPLGCAGLKLHGGDFDRPAPAGPSGPEGAPSVPPSVGEAGGGSAEGGDRPLEAEIKRVWVSETARGLGLGRRLMAELEERARDLGATAVCLDSNAALVEAITLYRRLGYAEVPAFNDEPHADHWFRKDLGVGQP